MVKAQAYLLAQAPHLSRSRQVLGSSPAPDAFRRRLLPDHSPSSVRIIRMVSSHYWLTPAADQSEVSDDEPRVLVAFQHQPFPKDERTILVDVFTRPESSSSPR